MKIKQKKGISLIVLVITIIVMIILATAIVLSLNSSGIIEKANKAKKDSDIATIKEVANIALGEYELSILDGTTTKTRKEYVEEYLNNQKLELPEEYFVNEEGNIVSKLVWDGTVATSFASGTGTETDPYIIETAAEFAYLAEYCNSGRSYGKYFKLTSDIDLNNLPWTPICNETSVYFGGIFDGDNHSIKNINVTDFYFAGLFGFVGYYVGNSTDTVVIKNVILESGSIVCFEQHGAQAGSIAAVLESSAKIENCINKANVSIGDNANSEYTYTVGGICGYISRTTNSIINCTNYGTITGKEGYTGQIFGSNTNNASITNCQELGTLNIVE